MFRRIAAAACLVVVASALLVSAQEPARHDLTIKAKNHQFSPARIDVTQGDVLKITLIAEDAPYSFVIDEYRVAKRAAPGKPATFEFRADRAGTFPFYCNMSTDAACKDMKGQLVVATK